MNILVPWKTRVYQLIQTGINSIKNLNIFDSQSANEHIQKNERLSTKVYIFLLVFFLIIFSLFILLTKENKIMTMDFPTQTQYEELNNHSSVENLQCPCNQISIQYNKFISLHPTFHQICSSIFISDLWKSRWNWYRNYYRGYSNDFSYISSDFFSSLLQLCQLSNQATQNSLKQFNTTEYITSQVTPCNTFDKQIESYINRFQTTTQQTFEQTLNILRAMISDNSLMSFKLTNVQMNLRSRNLSSYVDLDIIDYDQCSCATNSFCKIQIFFHSSRKCKESLKGMYAGCYILESVLLSTTECFFDPYCIQIIKYYLREDPLLYKNLFALNQSQLSRYATNTSFENLLANLFIENWNENYSYEKYYRECQPMYCSYSINQQPKIVDVISKVLGIFGGLSIVLKFIVPIIVNRIRKEKRREEEHEGNLEILVLSKSEQIQRFFQLIKEKLSNLNLFQTKSNNNITVRRQKLTTKFYLILLAITLVILVIYTSVHQITVTRTIQLKNRDHYEDLKIKYPSTLHCSCNQISIEYGKFLEIHFLYNQICSSIFVTQTWINYLYDSEKQNDRNYQATASAQFRVLASFCQVTQVTVNTSLQQFYARKFLRNELISSDVFETQIQSFIRLFQISVPYSFKGTLDAFRGLIHGNAYISTFQTNWKFTVLDFYDYAPLYTNPQLYTNSCNCASSSKCIQPVIITEEYPLGSVFLMTKCALYSKVCEISVFCKRTPFTL